METYRGDWNVENRVTAESEFPLRVAFVTRRERNLSFLIFSIKFKSEAIFFFFFNFTIDTPFLTLFYLISGSMVHATVN